MKPRAALAAAALASALATGEGSLALAEPSPAPAPGGVPALPPEIRDNPIVQSILNALNGALQTTNGNTARGKVTYFKRFDLQLELSASVFRDVHLHQGTTINPRGTTLAPGMVVDVSGKAEKDGSLDADVITVR